MKKYKIAISTPLGPISEQISGDSLSTIIDLLYSVNPELIIQDFAAYKSNFKFYTVKKTVVINELHPSMDRNSLRVAVQAATYRAIHIKQTLNHDRVAVMAKLISGYPTSKLSYFAQSFHIFNERHHSVQEPPVLKEERVEVKTSSTEKILSQQKNRGVVETQQLYERSPVFEESSNITLANQAMPIGDHIGDNYMDDEFDLSSIPVPP